MAPPPNSAMPLQERLLSLAKTLQCTVDLPPPRYKLLLTTPAVAWFIGYVGPRFPIPVPGSISV